MGEGGGDIDKGKEKRYISQHCHLLRLIAMTLVNEI